MRKIVLRFVGIRKYNSCIEGRYNTTWLIPNIANSMIKADSFDYDFVKYCKLQLKQGYYPLTIIGASEFKNGIILMILRSWHRIKQKLCLACKNSYHINGQRNITSYTSYHVIATLRDMGIDVQGEIKIKT